VVLCWGCNRRFVGLLGLGCWGWGCIGTAYHCALSAIVVCFLHSPIELQQQHYVLACSCACTAVTEYVCMTQGIAVSC
jgi:hypothetical protein